MNYIRKERNLKTIILLSLYLNNIVFEKNFFMSRFLICIHKDKIKNHMKFSKDYIIFPITIKVDTVKLDEKIKTEENKINRL